MARTLPQAILDALAAAGAEPSISVTSNDLMNRSAHLATTPGPVARTKLLLTSAGSVLRAALSQGADPNTVTIFRVTDPTNAAQWQAAGTAITTDALATAGVELVQTGSTIACFYIRSSDFSLCYRSSTNDGQSWSAEVVYRTGAPPNNLNYITGIAAISTTNVIVAAAVNSYSASGLFQSISGAAYVSVGPTSPTWAGIRGLAVDTSKSPYVFVAGVQMRNTASGFAAAATTLAGSTWSAFTAIAPMDTGTNGLSYAYPTVHYNAADGYYYAAVSLQDSGAVSGLVQNRVYLFRSTDAVTWQHLTSLGNVTQLETHLFFSAGALYALDNQSVYQAPSPLSPYDLTADVLALQIHEQASQPTRFALTLSNQNGQYNAQPQLRDNARLAISLGYNGTTILTHYAYIDAVEYRCSPDSQEVIITARDLSKFLDQINTIYRLYAGATIATLATTICALANVALAPLPSTSQFSQTIPSFAILNGESFLQALKRLADVYDFELSTTTTPSVKLTERAAADAVTFAYSTDTLGIAWQLSADQPNIIRVVGASPGSTNLFAEAIDSTNLAASGAHRFRQIVDRMIGSSVQAQLKANLALRDEQTRSQSGTLTVSLNPQLELLDVISITDDRIGLASQHARIMAILTTIDFDNGEWIQHLDLELP